MVSKDLTLPSSFDDLHWNRFHRVMGEASLGVPGESSALDGRTLFRRLKMQVPLYYIKR